MRTINVLFFSHYAEMYGANYSTLYLMSELNNKYQVKPFIIIPERGTFIKKLREKEIPYLCVNFELWMRNNGSSQRKLQTWLEMECINHEALRKIENQLQERNFVPDVVVSASSMMNIGMQYAVWKKKKHVWFIRECNEQYNFTNIYPACVARLWWRQSEKIICISKFALREFRRTYGRIGNEVVLYNGVDTDCKAPERNQLNKTSHIKFCIVGLVSENKGQYFITKCFKKIYDMGYINFELFIVGNGNSIEINRIRQLCKGNDFGKNVKLLGYCSNVQELLRDMDIGIMASYKEMFGRTTVEYMMSGMPVIASTSGANEEIVLDGKTGYIYEFNNERDFIEKIKCCLEFPENLNVLGENGKARAEEYFTKEKNARGFYKILQSITK